MLKNFNNLGKRLRRNKVVPFIPENLIDTCYICSTETIYQKNTPISCRDFYVKELGQLCPTCFNNLYYTNSRNETISKTKFVITKEIFL